MEQCFPKRDAAYKAAVVCCGDLEEPLLTWFVGHSTDGEATAEFQFFADASAATAFSAPAVPFTTVTFRIVRIADDAVHPFNVRGTPEIPVFYSSNRIEGIDEEGEWLQFTIPLEYHNNGGVLSYFSDAAPETKIVPFSIGTGLWVTGPNPPGSPTAFNYFELSQPGLVAISEERSVGGIPKLKPGNWLFVPANVEGNLAASTAPVSGLLNVLDSLPDCSFTCPVVLIPPAFDSHVYMFLAEDPATQFDRLLVGEEFYRDQFHNYLKSPIL
mmetsp:Transcript_22094/g.61329  ORF Transcript_22094/g.61329 Transcript_22094/m.61329 type:complete len:271 (+) Transcript_22094:382-1194(+)